MRNIDRTFINEDSNNKGLINLYMNVRPGATHDRKPINERKFRNFVTINDCDIYIYLY